MLAGTLTLGVAGGLHPVLAALLPADQRHVGEVQPAPVGHGGLRAHLHAARHAGRRRVGPRRRRGAERRAGTCAFEHVWFAYDGDDTTCCGTCPSRCAPGERVGIVGRRPARARRTIINLLLRFYDVSRGRILVDGVDIREMDLGELRRRFSLVLQDVHVFSGTIGGEHAAGRTRRSTRSRCGGRSRRCTPTASSTRLPQGAATPVARARGDAVGRARSSCCRSPGRWPSTRGSSCSTRRRRASTPRPSC
ncbi:MAG: ABC transporter ATP-binding protein/permease [Candidatus Moduliflexus flocculans]|nr:ABC transporter ATP-binding protein/permease [Candidatus Moduliflexus flocculans]